MFLPKSAFILFVFAGLFGVPSIFAQNPSDFGKCPVEYGFQGTYNFPNDYKASVTVRNAKELSPTILSKIHEQLKTRVGEEFFKKLELDYGYARDFDDASPLAASEAQRIDGYDFVFKFSDQNKGLKAFYFKVVADSKGDLIEDLALPDIASNPQKGEFIPCREALSVAQKNGFPLKRSSIYFHYDWDSQAFVWDIHDSKAVKPDEPLLLIGQGTYRIIFIDANSGKVLKIFKETIAV